MRKAVNLNEGTLAQAQIAPRSTIGRSSRLSLLILSAAICFLSYMDSDFNQSSFMKLARAEEYDEDFEDPLSLDPTNGGISHKEGVKVLDFDETLD